MGNFHELIESKAVREHCAKINYELDAIECAYLVWDNNDIIIEEKHRLYEKIIKETNDINIVDFDGSKISFFEALKEHIRLEKETITAFKEDADKKIYERFGRMGKLKTLKKDFSGYVTNTDKNIEAYYNRGKITGIQTDSWIENYFFLSCISLPVPFEKGDIIRCFDNVSNYSPCIFDCVCNDSEDDDNSHAYVYITYSGKRVDRVMAKCSKMDLYSEELKGEEKIYQALSDTMKGKISPAALMNIQYGFFAKKHNMCALNTNLTTEENDYIKKFFAEGEC